MPAPDPAAPRTTGPHAVHALHTTHAVRRALLCLAVCAGALAVPDGAEAKERAAEQKQGLTQQVLFRPGASGAEQGYSCFRTPAVVRTVKGTLLAFAEGRVHDCGDAGDIDLVVKRSTDGGRSWGPLRVADHGRGDTHGNPEPVVDRETGRVLLAETWNKGRSDGKPCALPCDRTPHLRYSDDDGLTFSHPRDLSGSLRPGSWNAWYATGPVHGIQLAHGTHKGRLLLGVNAESWRGGSESSNHAALVYSDDGGASWRRGATDDHPYAADGTFRQKPQELALAELGDGTVRVSAREEGGSALGHRTSAVSTDGGASFRAPFRAQPELYTPQVQGSLLRLPDGGDGGGSKGDKGGKGSAAGRMLLSAPADPAARRTMAIRSSWDSGATWDDAGQARVVTDDWCGYSDMVRAGARTTGLLYEGGGTGPSEEIRFARFTDGWLGPRHGPRPTTADRAPGAKGALVLGAPRAVPGHRGRALALDGADDAVRLPYRSQLPLDERDFTVSLWFRHSMDTGGQPLLSMGGTGGTQPGVSLRTGQSGGRIEASLTAQRGARAPGTTRVATARAYDDGRWHHAVLRRGGGLLRLAVDGERVQGADVAGSVSLGSPFGVHLGQRMDGGAYYRGALDAVRVTAGGTVTDLPLDGVRRGVRGP